MNRAEGTAENRAGHTVHLAYMECLTSCVLTYLHRAGMDERLLLLDYWNLNYQYRTLLSGKEARQLPLLQLYGVSLQAVRGTITEMIDCVRGGKSVVYLCAAGRLPYFPRAYLTMESVGFRHAILLDDWHTAEGRLRVADPIVDVVTRLAPDTLAHATEGGAEGGLLTYFTLEAAPEGTAARLAGDAALTYCSKRLLHAYRNDRSAYPVSANDGGERDGRSNRAAWLDWFGNRHAGLLALERFADDLAQSTNWEDRKRAGWIDGNIMTIASIKRVRSLVWEQYATRAPWSPARVRDGDERLSAILAAWNALSFQLLKYKAGRISEATAIVPVCRDMAERIGQDELAFLTWLRDSCEGGEEG